jgi:hypothetical protein
MTHNQAFFFLLRNALKKELSNSIAWNKEQQQQKKKKKKKKRKKQNQKEALVSQNPLFFSRNSNPIL